LPILNEFFDFFQFGDDILTRLVNEEEVIIDEVGVIFCKVPVLKMVFLPIGLPDLIKPIAVFAEQCSGDLLPLLILFKNDIQVSRGMYRTYHLDLQANAFLCLGIETHQARSFLKRLSSAISSISIKDSA
jgi:hypothetical protein